MMRWHVPWTAICQWENTDGVYVMSPCLHHTSWGHQAKSALASSWSPSNLQLWVQEPPQLLLPLPSARRQWWWADSYVYFARCADLALPRGITTSYSGWKQIANFIEEDSSSGRQRCWWNPKLAKQNLWLFLIGTSMNHQDTIRLRPVQIAQWEMLATIGSYVTKSRFSTNFEPKIVDF